MDKSHSRPEGYVPPSAEKSQSDIPSQPGVGAISSGSVFGDARYLELVGSLDDMVCELTALGQFAFVSPVSEKIFGYGPEHLVGKTLAEILVAPADDHLSAFYEALTYRTAFRLRAVTVTHRDGSPVPTQWAGKPLFDADSTFLGFRAICRDMSEWVNAQEELRRSEEKFSLAFDRNPVPMAIIDLETGHYSEVNRRFERITGFSRHEFIGRPSSDFVQKYGEPSIASIVLSLERGDGECEEDISLLRKDGGYALCRLAGEPIALSGRASMLLSFTDVTQIRRAEAEVTRLTNHDRLTGLHNRYYCESKIRELDRPEYLPLSVIMGDVNGLRLTNNGFGREQGDNLLRLIAEILTESCRKSDIVCRWGEDEFAILLPKTSEAATRLICERIQQRCRGVTKFVVTPSVSLGAATKEHAEQNFDRVIRRAENHMYGNKLVEGRSVRSSIVSSLLSALGEREHGTEEHARQLELLSKRFGRHLGLAPNLIDDLALLAALHDIGKLDVPPRLLQKPGPLTADEWEEIKRHPEVGYRIVRFVPELSHVAEAILAHHERWDGTGYPYGLAAERIPFLSRFIAVVDAYDVMTSGRPYRPACTPEQAIAELRAHAGTQFDPRLVGAFVEFHQSATTKSDAGTKSEKPNKAAQSM